jgi:threonine/homoserine/homoserine lactone efflux protein
MDFAFFLKGFLIGISIAAPVGPIGLLTIRRTLAFGRIAGFMSGLGAATADAVFGSIAAFGITAISSVLIGAKVYLGVVGGIFLIYLGWQTFVSKPAEQAAESRATSLGVIYFSTFLLVLTNPISILYFTAIISSVGAAGNLVSAAAMVFGVFLGSVMWWFFLSFIASLLKSRINPTNLKLVNQVSGFVIAAFGAWAVASVLFKI